MIWVVCKPFLSLSMHSRILRSWTVCKWPWLQLLATRSRIESPSHTFKGRIMHTLHASLLTSIEQKRLKALTMAQLHKKQANGTNMCNIALWQGRLVEILESAAQKLRKYVSKQLQFAQESRICDPRQIATLSATIEDFPHVFPSDQCEAIVDNGEWRLFRENVVPQHIAKPEGMDSW